MEFIRRLLGLCRTPLPENPECWTFANGVLEVNLERAPELRNPGGALRLEGKALPQRVLVVRDEDGGYIAFRNACSHAGRRLDPLSNGRVQCCSVGKSTFERDGHRISGSAKKDITVYPVERQDDRLRIPLN